MSRLRAKCPDCRTYTAVALGPEYECHSCGREFAAGLVRVPRAWGEGGEAMAEAAHLPLDYPEAAVVEEDSLAEQTLAIAAELPDRPLVLGGCCCCARRRRRGALCAARPARARLARRARRPQHARHVAVRQRVGHAAADDRRRRDGEAGERRADRRAQPRPARGDVHRRERDPHRPGCRRSRARRTAAASTSRSTSTSLEPGEITPFMPEPDGLTLDEVERLFVDLPGPLHGGRRRPQRPRSRPGQRRAARAPDPRARAVTRAPSLPGLTSRRWRGPESTSRSSTNDAPRAGCGKKHPNTCPKCQSHYRDDELEANLWRLPALRPPLPGARPRADRAARRRGQLRRGGRRPPLGRPARLLRPAAVQRAARRGRARRPGSATRW